MMSYRAKRHHIIPEYLIRYFSNREGKVWVHDMIERKSYPTNPVNVACIKDFYTVETTGNKKDDCIEQDYLSEGERLSSPVVEKIVKRNSLPTIEEWNDFSAFIALMYVRGTWFRRVISKTLERNICKIDKDLKITEDKYQEILSEIEKQDGIKYDVTFEEFLLFQESGQYKLSVDIPTEYYIRGMLESVINLTPIIFRMTPNIIFASPTHSARFVTSDWPFGPDFPNIPENISGPKGLNHRDMQLYIPLNPWTCLMLNYEKYPKCIRVNQKAVAFVNNLVALNCIRQIISNEQKFCWINRDKTISCDVKEFIELYTSAHSKSDKISQAQP
jgi:hypothetical protein